MVRVKAGLSPQEVVEEYSEEVVQEFLRVAKREKEKYGTGWGEIWIREEAIKMEEDEEIMKMEAKESAGTRMQAGVAAGLPLPRAKSKVRESRAKAESKVGQMKKE